MKIPLKIGALTFRILPNFFCKFLWDIITPFSGHLFAALRYMLLSGKAEIGDNVYIGSHVIFKNWAKFKCGDNVSVHDLCYIDAYGGISIGNDVSIAHGSSLVSFNHCFDDLTLPIKYTPTVATGIIINQDVWVGCGVRILDGVTIGTRVVVAAGAVVSKSIESNHMVGGVPAKIIKRI